MVKLASGHYYRFPKGNVARADVAENGWWQLTELDGVLPGPDTPTGSRTWGIAPSGAFYDGPVLTATDGGTTAGSALAFHQDGLTEVVRSGIDTHAGAAYMWQPAPAAVA